MPVHVFIGCQWGDEGKGKTVHYFSRNADAVARYGGGHNAGHTVVFNGQKYVLHSIPVGILAGTRCVEGNGTVIDPISAVEEIEYLTGKGIDVNPGRLFISDRAHVIMPHYMDEEMRSGAAQRIGTTKKGIGVAYTHKADRTGIRIGDLYDSSRKGEIREMMERSFDASKTREMHKRLMAAAETLQPFVTDTVSLLNDWLRDEVYILAEGAQGTELDLDHGTYPFVTSSNTGVGGCINGLGIPASAIKRVTGVLKAYTTRVGEGPFPTELNDETGERLRNRGKEYGATTGRPRRTGWLDLVQARHAGMINGFTDIALTKLDVLSGEPELRMCKEYISGRSTLTRMPSSATTLALCRPVYAGFRGWEENLEGVRNFHDLPQETKAYVRAVENALHVPVETISIGPDREQTFLR